MGNRFLRKKTRRVKIEDSRDQGVKDTSENPTQTGEPSNPRTPSNNGYLWCMEGHQITIDVCIVRQTRSPQKCKLCGYFKKVA